MRVFSRQKVFHLGHQHSTCKIDLVHAFSFIFLQGFVHKNIRTVFQRFTIGLLFSADEK